jgi:hypothetical protein
MRDRALSLLVPMSPPLVLGIVLVVVLIAARTRVVYSGRVAAELWLGCACRRCWWSGRWRVALGVARAILGVAASDFFHLWPALRFVRAVFSGAGGIRRLSVGGAAAGFVAALCRSPAIDADERRAEADLATVMARVLLRSHGLRLALPGGLAGALGPWAAAIELGAAVGGGQRVQGRVVASVDVLLRAARERGGMGSAVAR